MAIKISVFFSFVAQNYSFFIKKTANNKGEFSGYLI